MKQQTFEAQHEAEWSALEGGLDLLESKGAGAASEELPTLYRRVCQHLAMARERQYGAGLVDRLNGLVLRGHQQLYGTDRGLGLSWFRFLALDFPRAVRARWRPVLLSTLLFFGPTVGLSLAVPRWPELAYLIEQPQELAKFEGMYGGGKDKFGRKDQADTDLYMFGFYLWNNVRIDFQVFASGMLAGIGSIFFVFWNGMHGGAVAGHLTRVGLGLNFWSFVITHSAVEVTGLVLAGAAGMDLGWALLAPGRRSRAGALREAVRKSQPLLYGAAGMTVVAAFFEAFWSSSGHVAPSVKFAVGGAFWAVVLAYLLLAGRGRRD
jgi:uncharacterized membrane protein SpoIIM required for sporulation